MPDYERKHDHCQYKHMDFLLCMQPTMKAVGWFGWFDQGHHGSMYAHAIP
jgi:hypothetical protein